MRVALYAAEERGVRIARVLLAERITEQVGLFDDEAPHPKVTRVDDLTDFTVLIIDELDARGLELLERAVQERIDVVSSGPVATTVESPASTIVHDAANPASLALALAAGAPADGPHTEGSVMGTVVAWTEPGRAYRNGEAVAFPSPVGSRWARETQLVDVPSGTRTLVAPGDGAFTGAHAGLTVATDAGVRTSSIAVVDHTEFLRALQVAAATLATAEGAYGSGVRRPGDRDGAFLRAAKRGGMEAALLNQTTEARDA